MASAHRNGHVSYSFPRAAAELTWIWIRLPPLLQSAAASSPSPSPSPSPSRKDGEPAARRRAPCVGGGGGGAAARDAAPGSPGWGGARAVGGGAALQRPAPARRDAGTGCNLWRQYRHFKCKGWTTMFPGPCAL